VPLAISEYQERAASTSGANGDTTQSRLLWGGVSAIGELGEFLNKVKKRHRHGHDVPLDELTEELGDTVWYIADILTALGVDMSDVLEFNLDKLAKRYPDGFSREASQNR